jgi:hypothetical protein
MDLFLVVRNNEGKYLDAHGEWGNRECCWEYESAAAFTDAEYNGAQVLLAFANGREIPITYNEIFRKSNA